MKKISASSLIGLLCLLFAASTFAQQPVDQARMFQANATHTGAVTNAGIAPPLKQKWTVSFGQKISYPVIADGRVFVTVRNASAYGSSIYALNAASGATLWSYALEGSYYWSALCYENGRVFALNGSGMLRAFDPASGVVIWSRQLPGYSFSSAPTVYQGLIYTSGNGVLYAVNADTGAVVWNSPVINGDTSSPAVTNEGVYVSYSCPNVEKFNPLTGALIWKNNSGCSGGGGKTPVLYNGRLYVRDSTDSIWDSQTGVQIGTYNTKNAPVFSGSRGYFLNGPHGYGSYGTLEGRDLSNNNSVVWSFAGDGQLQSGVLYADGYVFVGSNSGKLYAVNALSGQQVWSTSTGSSIPYVDEHNVSQPLTSFAAGEGLLVVPTTTTLVAYENDYTPPSVNWGVSTPAPNGLGWNKTAVDLPFTLSGVGTASPASPLHFTSEGANQTQDVTLTDRSGNNSSVTSPVVKIDWTAPLTSIMLTGSEGGEWYTSALVTLSSDDSLSGVANTFYKVGSGPTQIYNAPFSITNNGTYTITYWSVDVAGNIESSHSTNVKIDGSAPVTQASVSGTPVNGWYTDPVQVTLSATDNSAGVAASYYVVDGGATQTYSTPFNVLGSGSHVVQYWSVDEVGNTESQRSLTINVDGSAPSTQAGTTGVVGTNGWYKSAVQVSLTASDNNQAGVATIYYRVDGGPIQTYSNTFSIGTEGVHQINYWSVDRLGNTEVQKSLTVKIDWTGSTVQNSVTGIPGGNNYFKSEVQVSLTSSDNLSGVAATYYRVDDGPTQNYTSTFTVAGDGIHPVDFWSTDLAGNSTYSYRVMIRIDTTGPVTIANLSGTAGSNGWYKSAVQISMSAADNFNGVAATYYRVDGGATTTYSAPFNYSTAGTHTLSFWSVDTIFNTETVKMVPLKIDSVKPTITMSVSPSTANKSATPVTVTVSGRVTDATSGVSSLTYNVVDEYGVTQPSGSVTWQSNGNYSFTLTLPATRNVGDKTHLYTINMQVVDQAGNSNPASGTVVIK